MGGGGGALTALPDARLAAPVEALARRAEVRGVFLGGSHGRGRADAWSDIDLIAVAEPAEHAAIADAWGAALDAAITVVHRMERRGRTTLLNAIGADWLRVDLLLVPDLGGRARDLLAPLHDPLDLRQTLPETLPPATPDPGRVASVTREFLRVLGLLPVGVGRGEAVTLLVGLGHLRDLLIRLMLEECAEADRGGALHLSRLLPPARMAALAALPTPPPEPNAIVQAHLAYAETFLPLARTLHRRLGIAWPAAFEEATRRHLRHALGVTLPHDGAGGI